MTTTADISIEKEEDVIYLKSVFHEPLSQPGSDYLRFGKIRIKIDPEQGKKLIRDLNTHFS